MKMPAQACDDVIEHIREEGRDYSLREYLIYLEAIQEELATVIDAVKCDLRRERGAL